MKGIMFKEELFKAVIAGRKTQTRRIVPPVKNHEGTRIEVKNYQGHSALKGYWAFELKTGIWAWIYPRYRIGDQVYLKEPYMPADNRPLHFPRELIYKYGQTPLVSQTMEAFGAVWKNKMFMPADQARYFIKITRVRCERLTDITEADAIAEGVTEVDKRKIMPEFYDKDGNWIIKNGRPKLGLTPMGQFERLWESINGSGSWNLNPWVWVYEFELTTKP
jgi:uncharacterized protein YqfB (UPF0267 family)